MAEAVIVSTARSPIGRAGKGSLVNMRPDDYLLVKEDDLDRARAALAAAGHILSDG